MGRPRALGRPFCPIHHRLPPSKLFSVSFLLYSNFPQVIGCTCQASRLSSTREKGSHHRQPLPALVLLAALVGSSYPLAWIAAGPLLLAGLPACTLSRLPSCKPEPRTNRPRHGSFPVLLLPPPGHPVLGHALLFEPMRCSSFY